MNLRYNNLVIRLATKDDAEYLCKYWHESGWNISIEEAGEMLDKGRGQHMIEIDGRIIGDIHYGGNIENGQAEIGIYIRDGNERCKGYATLAMSIYIDALINILGYNKIRIATGTENKAMRHISEDKFGLKPIMHENVYQIQSRTYESYVEYILLKENWRNKFDYKVY